MNTTRRTFLTRLVAAAGLTTLATRAAAPKQPYIVAMDPALPGSDLTAKHAYRVEGVAIKVPSNRVAMARATQGVGVTSSWHEYEGNWDGSFKLERGCANPAFILADLYERTKPVLPEPDWVLQDSVGFLDWTMLYNWGRWCDDEECDWKRHTDGSNHAYGDPIWTPRFTVNTLCQTPEDMDRLREDLRMRCLQWQSTDPRYRTSYPGVPYPRA